MSFKFSGILACLFGASLSFAQAQDVKSKGRLYLSDLYIQTGFVSQGDVSLSLEDYRRIAPESKLLKNDLSSYEGGRSSYYGGYRYTSPLFSMLVGINFREKPNWQLRVGFTQFREDLANLYLQHTARKPYDTLVSAQTGAKTYVDSVNRKSYSIGHFRQQMRFEASLIYRTNPEKRWSFYAGIGASLNLQLNPRTSVLYFETNYTEISNSNTYRTSYFNSSEYVDKREEFTHKSSLGVSFFAPIGVDFRIGKKHSVWSKVHLFYEARPMLSFSRIDQKRQFSLMSGQHNFGLRFVFGK